MANPRQRRKARSGSTMKPSLNAKKQMKKKLVRAPTVHGPDVLKDSYDPKLTLRQNYAKLGLIPSLDVRPDTGGTERPTSSSTTPADADAPVRKGMARIIRDDDGNIIDIIEASDDTTEDTPWGQPLPNSVADSNDIETFMPASKGAQTKVIAHLQHMADQAAPVARHTSNQESQWLADLVRKHGDDVEAMAKDLKLNVWQKTQGEIKRAIKKAGGFEAFKQ